MGFVRAHQPRAVNPPFTVYKETRVNTNLSVTSMTATTVALNTAALNDNDATSVWMSQGNCRNYPPATFFPSDGVGVDRARKICNGCPVLDTCLEYALENRIEHGVWGGCSERERRRIIKRRKVAV